MEKSYTQKLKPIITFLKQKYNPESLILVGSRAVGDYKPQSDWDVYVFTKKKVRKQAPDDFYASLPEELKEEDLDVYLNSLNEKSFGPKLWRDLGRSKVIFDTNDFGKRLRKKALVKYKKKPELWSKEYAQGRVYKAQRYMKKMEDCLKDKDYASLYLRFCWHYAENVIDWWFGIRQERKLRSKEALEYIKKKDPAFYKQLRLVFNETTYTTKVKAYKKIHEMLFTQPKFKRLVA